MIAVCVPLLLGFFVAGIPYVKYDTENIAVQKTQVMHNLQI